MVEGAAGFWSYVRDDDAGDDERITQLAEDVRKTYGLKTGSDLELFVDRTDVRWGDAWEARINDAIAGTTFFIPIVTPRYFQSDQCRREFLKFTGEARRFGLEQLLLPIYYVNVPELEMEPEDEVMALVAKRHWEDFRETRLVDPGSASYRASVDQLAGTIAEVAAEITRRPRDSLSAARSSDPEEAEPVRKATENGDKALGMVEVLAEGEEALPRLNATIEQLTVEIERLGRLGEEGAAEMNASDARGAGFAGRLAATERLAKQLGDPAKKVRELGRAYATDLVKIDPAMRTILDQLESDPSQVDDEARGLLATLRTLQAEAEPAMRELDELTRALAEAAKLSRSIRAPLAEIRGGLQGIFDGKGVIEEWARRATELEGGNQATAADNSEPTGPSQAERRANHAGIT